MGSSRHNGEGHGSGRSIPVSPEVARLLQEYAQRDAMAARERQVRGDVPLAAQVAQELDGVRRQLEGGLEEVNAALTVDSLTDAERSTLDGYRLMLARHRGEVNAAMARALLASREWYLTNIDKMMGRLRERVAELAPKQDEAEAAAPKLAIIEGG